MPCARGSDLGNQTPRRVRAAAARAPPRYDSTKRPVMFRERRAVHLVAAEFADGSGPAMYRRGEGDCGAKERTADGASIERVDQTRMDVRGVRQVTDQREVFNSTTIAEQRGRRPRKGFCGESIASQRPDAPRLAGKGCRSVGHVPSKVQRHRRRRARARPPKADHNRLRLVGNNPAQRYE